jgi:uncharacterized membrane protein YeaQ/YmgE (transglycosylase-associated protein family)
MFWILGWLFFGLIIGLLAKAIHPGEDPVGFFPTLSIGVAGSFLGGIINWILSLGGPFQPAGILMSIVGGVLCCWLYRRYKLSKENEK